MTSRIAQSPEGMRLICRTLETIEAGQYPLEVVWRKPRRTNAQNRYLWGVVYNTLAAGMSEQAGEMVEPKRLHELCKQFFMPRVGVPGTDKTVPISTTELCRSGNEESFQDYVLQIQELAARKGIIIPDPEET